MRYAQPGMVGDPGRANRDLLWPYLVPYIIYVGLGPLIPEAYAPTWTYVLRLVLVPAALLWGFKHYAHVLGPRSPILSVLVGLGAGIAGTALWIVLKSPFVQPPGDVWEPLDWTLRLVSSTLLPPVFEELVMRGFVFGLILQWDQARRKGHSSPIDEALDRCSLHDLKPGEVTIVAAIGSSIVFALGHAPAEWIAAVAYGLLMVALWVYRQDLLTCMVAHATTNFALALYVKRLGAWHLW